LLVPNLLRQPHWRSASGNSNQLGGSGGQGGNYNTSGTSTNSTAGAPAASAGGINIAQDYAHGVAGTLAAALLMPSSRVVLAVQQDKAATASMAAAAAAVGHSLPIALPFPPTPLLSALPVARPEHGQALGQRAPVAAQATSSRLRGYKNMDAQTFSILCCGPGPHTPSSGVLGMADSEVTGMPCPNPICQAGYTAQQAATPGGVLQDNAATIQANIQAHMATISAWIAANPSGATLSAAQTLVLAKLLYGIGLILRQEFSTTTGT
jgi:hypothetical protein